MNFLELLSGPLLMVYVLALVSYPFLAGVFKKGVVNCVVGMVLLTAAYLVFSCSVKYEILQITGWWRIGGLFLALMLMCFSIWYVIIRPVDDFIPNTPAPVEVYSGKKKDPTVPPGNDGEAEGSDGV